MAELTSERIEELRRVAEAATPIGWMVGNLLADERQVMTADGYLVVATVGEAKNAWHIAAFDPPTVLALLADLERLQKEVQQLRDRLTCMCGSWVDQHTIGDGHSPVSMYDYEIDQLREEIERLRRALDETGRERETLLGTIGDYQRALTEHHGLEGVRGDQCDTCRDHDVLDSVEAERVADAYEYTRQHNVLEGGDRSE